MRQVVGIGGQVGETYSYTALELVCSATAPSFYIALDACCCKVFVHTVINTFFEMVTSTEASSGSAASW